MSKVKVGIIGGAGYTAGELLRILLNHPCVDITLIQSESHARQTISEVHQDLFYAHKYRFTDEINGEPDVFFLCKGHGESVRILQENRIDGHSRIIDLSQDFRLTDANEEIQKNFGRFIYGLPELNRKKIQKAKNIANPGCFATCIELALLPLAKGYKLPEDIHISAITGSTGAGQSLTTTSHFTWRDNNMSVYKPFKHQHLAEIYQSLKQFQNNLNSRIHFIPYRGNFTRGIIATLYLRSDMSQPEISDLYQDYYQNEPFVIISKVNPNLKQVTNTNYCLLYIEKFEDQIMIISVIDNLLKGASGQAVQNMNLILGIDEKTGLSLKGSAF
jgi:N-acetyl-gamma-glutamyl-phosphate reductase